MSNHRMTGAAAIGPISMNAHLHLLEALTELLTRSRW